MGRLPAREVSGRGVLTRGGEEAFPGLGEPARVRAQPPAKVEFTPSRAGPGFFVFSLFIIAGELSPSFPAMLQLIFFLKVVFFVVVGLYFFNSSC